MEKIYLYKSCDVSVSYDSKNWYINDEAQVEGDNISIDTLRSIAEVKAYSLMKEIITTYCSNFRNLAILTAAGTSMENGNNGGKTRTELWDSYKDDIIAIKNIISKNAPQTTERCDEIINAQNIEDFLSFVILYEKINGVIVGEDGVKLRENIERKIADACRLILDQNNSHHASFLQKITSRKMGLPRVQLYTTNYDTLFEQAAQRLNYTIIDGFSFSYPRVFNGSNFDKDLVYRKHTRVKQEDSFVPGVFQLFKLHGSVDWEKRQDGCILQRENVERPCIIYPASEKYESSYEQPYFEMMSNLQHTLREEGTFLIIAGFGFQDKHIQNIIREAALQNHNFHLLIVCYGKHPHNIDGPQSDKDNQCDISTDASTLNTAVEHTELVNEIWLDGITPSLVPGYLDDKGTPGSNVTIIYSKFKEFVENFPMNDSYMIKAESSLSPII